MLIHPLFRMLIYSNLATKLSLIFFLFIRAYSILEFFLEFSMNKFNLSVVGTTHFRKEKNKKKLEQRHCGMMLNEDRIFSNSVNLILFLFAFNTTVLSVCQYTMKIISKSN